MSARFAMVVDGKPDERGRASFTLYWLEPHGVFRRESSSHDGKPVGYRRAQCYRAVPADHMTDTTIVPTHAAAIALAWHDNTAQEIPQ